jgi:hypothetical protein
MPSSEPLRPSLAPLTRAPNTATPPSIARTVSIAAAVQIAQASTSEGAIEVQSARCDARFVADFADSQTNKQTSDPFALSMCTLTVTAGDEYLAHGPDGAVLDIAHGSSCHAGIDDLMTTSLARSSIFEYLQNSDRCESMHTHVHTHTHTHAHTHTHTHLYLARARTRAHLDCRL